MGEGLADGDGLGTTLKSGRSAPFLFLRLFVRRSGCWLVGFGDSHSLSFFALAFFVLPSCYLRVTYLPSLRRSVLCSAYAFFLRSSKFCLPSIVELLLTFVLMLFSSPRLSLLVYIPLLQILCICFLHSRSLDWCPRQLDFVPRLNMFAWMSIIWRCGCHCLSVRDCLFVHPRLS